MGTNEEFYRIQSWIADWYGTSVEDCKYSREDIRDICRGPMREVLLDFILPRFRTDEQIKVFRSNLYLNDIQRNQDEDEKGKGISQQDRQIKNLATCSEKLQGEKVEIVRRISRASCKMTDTKMSLQRVIVENLATFENLEARVHFVRDRVQSTNSLLEDLNQIKPSTGPDSPTRATIINDPSSDTLSPRMQLLQTLSTNAITLFNHIFLPNGNASANSLETKLHTAEVTAKISELTQSGLSPNTVEKWAWKEQEKYSGLIKNAAVRYSNRMSPVEELSTEADALHVRLMKAHVDTHFKYRDLSRIHEELKARNTERIQNSVLSDDVVAPANLLSFVQKEEQQRKLIKCRELLEKFRNSDGSNDEDIEFLGLICDDFIVDFLESGSKSQQQNGENCKLNKQNLRMSLGPGDGISNFVKQETLEDLTIALLKSYPQSRQQLDATIKQCKNLVLERFPKLFLADQSGNDRKFANEFGSARGHGFSHSSEYQIKIPQHLLLNKCTIEASCIFQEQDEFVAEVTGLQSELEKNRLQCEILFKEMGLPS